MNKRQKSANRILAAWLPNWPIQRLTCKRPELRHRPLVLEAPSPRGQQVVACSAAARERGVRPGMLVAEAQALAAAPSPGRHTPGSPLHREPHQPDADRSDLEKLATWCHRFSPRVGLEMAPAAETLLLDATQLAALYGSEQALLEQLQQGLARLGLEARLAVAENIATSWAVAHYDSGGTPRVVAPGDNRTALAPLPLAALRLPAAVVQTLGELGIETVNELLSLPRDGLAARFGPELLQRLRQALGEEAEVMHTVAPPTDFTAQWFLEFPLAKWDQVQQVIERLLRQLAERLAADNRGALQVVCQLECQSAPDVTFEARLFRPSSDAAHLAEIVGMQTERLLLPGPVTAVKVQIARHALCAERQQVLFERDAAWHRSQPLVALVDRLAARLGSEAVVRCRLQADAQPEFAFGEDSLVGSRGPRRRKPRSQPPTAAALERPMRLFRRPVRLRTLTAMHHGAPVRFQWQGQQYLVARHHGPERIETGWWRGRSVRRDYYRVETSDGRRFWLFRCLRREQWFLHGAFE